MLTKIELTEDAAQIVDLWHRAFVGERLVSMLFLLDCTYNGQQGAYVYAVATHPDYRKQGFMQKCIDYSQALDYDFLCLVPAEAYLFDVYAKFGFQSLLFGTAMPAQLDDSWQTAGAQVYFDRRRAWTPTPAVELVDSDYLYRENVLLDGSFYCKDDGIAAVRDGRICEYIQKSGNVLTAEPVGMLWSRRALPPGYFGLYMD